MKKEFKKRTDSAKTWHFRTKLSAALSLMCLVSSTSMHGIPPDRKNSVHGEGSGNVSMSASKANNSLPHDSHKIDSEGSPSSMTALLGSGFNKDDKQASDSGLGSTNTSEASKSLTHGSDEIVVVLPEDKSCCDVLQKTSCGTGTRIATSLLALGGAAGATFAGLWQAGYFPAQGVATHADAASMAQPLPPVPCFNITSDNTTVSFDETCVQNTCDTLSFDTMQEACNRTVVKGSADEAFASIVAEQVASGQSVRVNMTEFMEQDQETGKYQTLVSRSAFNEAIDRHNLTAIDLSFDGTTGTWDNLGLFVDDLNTPATTTTAEPTTTTAEPTTTTPYLTDQTFDLLLQRIKNKSSWRPVSIEAIEKMRDAELDDFVGRLQDAGYDWFMLTKQIRDRGAYAVGYDWFMLTKQIRDRVAYAVDEGGSYFYPKTAAHVRQFMDRVTEGEENCWYAPPSSSGRGRSRGFRSSQYFPC